ncbi:indolepyruvate ferredoxin oxidoreductase [Rhodoligotrophos appendicifer]|uniref:indolepyruvate ferredoxin oxidoreductase family protein n=1 Tax=Rhodoligotrophos appendicifer TaxID=987056 RepID=UPI001185D25D|nr:indolepyruvate ferredoxin oxidoreductase family protein [Rhodoligotrophos appendicifer]
MSLRTVSLDDRYDLSKSLVLLSGVQALVRLTLMQRARDEQAGHNVAGYVTGYRGSPLGGLDQEFGRREKLLKKNHVVFQPGLNEDLAATAVWGAQQAEMRQEGAYDGVFGIWYGKGPGVDRCGDVFRHANAAGTSKLGGVLVLMGDDHTAESSTVAHQSEFALVDAMMPVLNPAGAQEILDYGLYGIAMSRFSGLWVGLKCVKDNVESTSVVDGSLNRVVINVPDDVDMPDGGLNIRPRDDRLEQEKRLHLYKRYAATAFARANKLDKIVFNGGRAPRIGIVTAGKSYSDVRQALDELGIDEVRAAELGIRLLKVAMVWPLDPQIIETFAQGLDLIMVVEEKRSLLETQIREQLYAGALRPTVIGKKDETGAPLFPAYGALDPNHIALEVGKRLNLRTPDHSISDHMALLNAAQQSVRNSPDLVSRIPYFCAGCPHNSSTTVPEGGRAYAGIGCHWMVQVIPERRTEGYTHMGGEGANWIGEAPFSKRGHVFQNLGDGTYNHSGYLAIRAAVAAKVNMTYKILYNDAVAMTGGQHHEGGLTVSMIANQVASEGVKRVVIVSDEPDKYPSNVGFPPFTTIHHRSELDAVQKELMDVEGVTVLIYDQTCAAEKRRRRKRGTYPDPQKRVFINELVCEGCGDCGVKSNCVAVAPVETDFGRKRQIDQSSCNKDYSCVNGFCPSFVTIEGGQLIRGQKRKAGEGALFEALPEPPQPSLDKPWGILITGIGGTGVVTIGQILGMAAYLEGKGAGIIDMAGLAQKNGAVVTHMKIARNPDEIASIRLAAGGADLLLGCDLVTSASEKNLAALAKGKSNAVVNNHETMPAQFTRNPDFRLPGEDLEIAIAARTGRDLCHFVDATSIATELLGDSIASNMFTLGYAYQKGLIPLGADAIERAIDLNGAAVAMNTQAFLWGRRAAHNLPAVERITQAEDKMAPPPARGVDEIMGRRAQFLVAYQDAAYAERYKALVTKVRRAEARVMPGSEALSEAVARYFFKLMAYKDEYEVARLYTDGTFEHEVKKRFEGDFSIHFHMAPPLLAKRDPSTGHLKKQQLGPWMMHAFRLLAKFKRLRGTPLDIFGYSSERKMERGLIAQYEGLVQELLDGLTPELYGLAVEIASIPEHIRGYGHVKEQHLDTAKANEAMLLAQFRSGKPSIIRQAAE